MVLPLDQLMNGGSAAQNNGTRKTVPPLKAPSATSSATNARREASSLSTESIMDQRRANALRNDGLREGEE